MDEFEAKVVIAKISSGALDEVDLMHLVSSYESWVRESFSGAAIEIRLHRRNPGGQK